MSLKKPFSYRELNNNFIPYEEIMYRYAVGEITIDSIKSYETLQEQGHSGYYILDGNCRLMISGPGGGEKISAVLKRGSFLQLYSKTVLSRAGSYFWVDPCPWVRALIFDEQGFQDLIINEHEIALKLLGFYENLSASLLCDLRDVLFCDGKKRVCNMLYDMSLAEHTRTLHISQEKISLYIGLERSNVARCLKQLKELGVIETGRNSITILNFEQLDEMVHI